MTLPTLTLVTNPSLGLPPCPLNPYCQRDRSQEARSPEEGLLPLLTHAYSSWQTPGLILIRSSSGPKRARQSVACDGLSVGSALWLYGGASFRANSQNRSALHIAHLATTGGGKFKTQEIEVKTEWTPLLHGLPGPRFNNSYNNQSRQGTSTSTQDLNHAEG